MITEERRSLILKIAEQSGFVSLQRLVAEVGVSESTIRRDLERLDSQGQLHRTRGGAAYAGDSLTDLQVRQTHASRQKLRIAEQTVEGIADGDTILLDGGTTTLEVARRLRGKSLQVVTNSLPIASTLMNEPNVELIFVGGYVYPKTGVALGDQAVRALEQIHVDQLIMGAGGITQEGLFNSNALLVETERRMIDSADQVTVVADSTKFGHRALAHLCALDSVQQIITDDGIQDEWIEQIEQHDIQMIVAAMESEIVGR